MKTALFLDFDNTCFDTERFFYVDLREAYGKLAVDETIWRKGTEMAASNGFSLEKQVASLAIASSGNVATAALQQIMNSHTANLPKYVFSDALSLIKKAGENNVHLDIATRGFKEWQNFKISHSGLKNYFNHVYCVDNPSEKHKIILPYGKKFDRIIFVDDTLSELNTVRDACPTVETYLLQRGVRNKTASRHNICSSLEEILF